MQGSQLHNGINMKSGQSVCTLGPSFMELLGLQHSQIRTVYWSAALVLKEGKELQNDAKLHTCTVTCLSISTETHMFLKLLSNS